MPAPILAGIGKVVMGVVAGTAKGLAAGARVASTTAKSSGRLVQSASNVKSNIIRSNKKIRKIKLNRKRISRSILNEQKRKAREKRLESTKRKQGVGVGTGILSSPVSSLKKLLYTIIGGLIISNLPLLIRTFESIKKGFDNFGKFVSNTKESIDRIFDTFTLDEMELEQLRKKIDDGLKSISDVFDATNLLNWTLPSFLNLSKNTNWTDEEGRIDPITEAGKQGTLNREGTGPERLTDTFSDPEKDIVTVDGVSTGKTAVQLAREKFYVDQSGNVRKHSDNKKANWEIIFQFPSVDKDQLEKKTYPIIQPSINEKDLNSSSINNENTLIVNQRIIKNNYIPVPTGVA